MKCQENNDIGCIKGELKFENYLDILEDKDKFALCRFRTTNHRLPVEVGRWKNIIREQVLSFMFKKRIGRRVSLYF